VHISELAQHHVENPREIVSQGDTVNVRILEVDAERRRLSLSLKRVDDGMPIQPGPGEEATPPSIDLSEDVFSDEPIAAAPLEEQSDEAEAPAEAPAAEAPADAAPADVAPADAAPADEVPVEASADEPAEGSDETAPTE